MFWSTRPFVRALIFLLSGIFLGYFVPFTLSLAFYFVIIGLLTLSLLLSIIWIKFNEKIKLQWVKGSIVGLTLVITGVLLVTLHKNPVSEINIEKTDAFIAEVINEPYPTMQSVKMILKVRPLNGEGSNEQPVQVIAFFEKNKNSELLKYGDRLLFQVKISHPRKPMNPGEFDYKSFLALNGIYYSVFIPDNKWQYIGNSPQNIFKKLAGQLRHYLLISLQNNGLEGRSYAVAAAILLGYDNLMDTELEQDFVTAGAMHILCVSGLHVGVIYLVFNLLLGFLRKNRIQQIIKALLLLLLVWAYAMLTGLSPSVQRATVMISIFIIGNALSRQRDSYNTLAASAFLLLIFNPLLIFNVGFQLSYMAVLGILTFHRPIYVMFYFKNGIIDKLWSVTVLSFAAQLGTFPLAAHYFHFFPTYFWLSNLLIFPLSFLIITVGMAFISVSWLPFIPKIVGMVLSGLVYLLNQLVGFVKYLPFHGINDLYFPWEKVLIVYLFIVLVFIMFTKKNIRLLIPFLSTILVLVFLETVHKFNVLKQKRIVVYSINKSSAYDFIRGGEHLLLIDSVSQNSNKKFDYFLTNSRLAWGLDDNQSSLELQNQETSIGLHFDGEFVVFNDFKIAIVNGSDAYFKGRNAKVKIDALIIGGKKSLKISKLQTCFEINTIILDASVPYWKSKKIEDEAENLDVSIYNVKKAGAFIFELE